MAALSRLIRSPEVSTSHPTRLSMICAWKPAIPDKRKPIPCRPRNLLRTTLTCCTLKPFWTQPLTSCHYVRSQTAQTAHIPGQASYIQETWENLKELLQKAAIGTSVGYATASWCLTLLLVHRRTGPNDPALSTAINESTRLRYALARGSPQVFSRAPGRGRHRIAIVEYQTGGGGCKFWGIFVMSWAGRRRRARVRSLWADFLNCGLARDRGAQLGWRDP